MAHHDAGEPSLAPPDGRGPGRLESRPRADEERSMPATLPPLPAFRCAHRGTRLSTGWVEGDDLRCFYHGWKYGPDGQCIEQPAEPEPFCSRIKIRGYPVQECLGLIFAYLGEGQPPELPRFPDFEKPGTLRISYYVRDCNFFN